MYCELLFVAIAVRVHDRVLMSSNNRRRVYGHNTARRYKSSNRTLVRVSIVRKTRRSRVVYSSDDQRRSVDTHTLFYDGARPKAIETRTTKQTSPCEPRAIGRRSTPRIFHARPRPRTRLSRSSARIRSKSTFVRRVADVPRPSARRPLCCDTTRRVAFSANRRFVCPHGFARRYGAAFVIRDAPTAYAAGRAGCRASLVRVNVYASRQRTVLIL